MSKKIWMLMLALCAVLCVVAVASAETCNHEWKTETEVVTIGSCTQDEEIGHFCSKCGEKMVTGNNGRKHDWVVTVLSAGDCTTNKIVKKTCACGVTEVENLGVQHKMEITVVPGTCFKPTWIGKKCANCEVKGDTLYQGTYADHTWVKSTKPGEFKNATCTAAGYAKMICAKCGATKQVTYPATGHNFMTTTQIVKATCGQDGGYLVKCTRCSATKIDVIKENGKPVDPMPAKKHEYSPASTDWTTVNATCQAPKYYKKTCTICGTVSDIAIPGEQKNPNAHKMALKTTVKAATCTEDGLGYYVCSLCGHDEYKIIASKTAHKLTVTRTEASTCAKEGVQYLACANCDYVTTKPVAKLPHVMVKKTFHGAVCGVDNMYTAMACVNCDYVDWNTWVDLGVPGDHEYELDTKNPNYIYAAPCSELRGVNTYKCKHCQDVKEEIYFADHIWKTTEEFVKPSCGQNGGYKMVCTECGKVGVDEVWENGQPKYPMDGDHDLIVCETVDATCHESGYQICQCSKCGELIKHNFSVNPDAHVLEVVEVLSAANCKLHINGQVVVECKYGCEGTKETVTLEWGNAHDWVLKEYKEPTCKDGYERYACSVCGGQYGRDIPAVKAHKFVKMTSTAKCEVPSLYGEFCEVCETAKYPDSVAWALAGNESKYYSVIVGSEKGHTETNIHDRVEATCVNNGSYKYDCPDCHKKDIVKTIPNKGGHNYIKGSYLAPNCTENARYEYVCSKCGDKKTEEIAGGAANLGGHLKSDVVKVKNETCMKNAYEYDVCKRCGAEIHIRDIRPNDPNKHQWKDEKVVTAATCTTNGLMLQKCSETGCTATQHVIIKATHAWDKGIVIDAGSCEKGATVKYTCTVCGDTKTETKAVEHAWVEDLVNADGTVVYKECSVCGKRVITQDFRPAGSDKNDCNTFGHKEVAIAGKAPTCTEKGLTAGTKCTVCGTVLVAQKEIDVLPHNFQGPSCADCGVANPDYVEHEHKCTKTYSFNADFTKRVVTYTCECGYTYSEEEDF